MDDACLIGADGTVLVAGDPQSAPWWSFTKTVLATAALKLVERGRLSLDGPVGDAPYSLRQLLRHETGLPDYGWVADYHRAVEAGGAPWSRDEMLARAEAERLRFAPGEGWSYSNIGYMRVSELVAEAAGAPLGAALQALVLEPAGAASAQLALQPSDLAQIRMGPAAGYHPGWVYHGLVVGPLLDAARVLHALLAGRLLDPATLAEMRDARSMPQFRTELWREPAYGLGLMTPGIAGGARLAGHTGGGPGSQFAAYGLTTEAGPLVAAVWTDGEGESRAEAAAVAQLLSAAERA